jgi:nitroreductase
MASFSQSMALFRNYIYDFFRYQKYSLATSSPTSLEHFEAKIAVRYHNIEKGLTLKHVRLGFGRVKIEQLFQLLDLYLQVGYDVERPVFQNALSVLDEYITLHKQQQIDVAWIEENIQRYKNSHTKSGGTVLLRKKDVIEETKKTFQELVESRHSIRNFSSEKVDRKLILDAVKMAQHAPSVCNRQSSRVYIIEDEKLKNKALTIHKGNSGFGDQIQALLIVTSELESFTTIGERNQPFIDGGLFGMTLVYALQSLGLATCMLNWSAPKERDLALRNTVKIKKSENIIFLIAVGHYPEEFKAAKSLRKPVEEIITTLE